MLIDARALPAGQSMHADVCIIGAGAAGLTIAQALAHHRVRVLVLEGGDRTPEHATQRLYEGVLSGRPYYPLDDCRVRMLGGTTTQWGGWCRPLDAIDFEARDWVPESGWPLDARQMTTFYQRAQSVCHLGPYDYDARSWAPPSMARLAGGDDGPFQDTVFQIRPTRFGEVHGSIFERSSTADVLLNAVVLEILTDRAGRKASGVRAATLRGNHLSVEADVLVLAAGGIENARLLLCSRSANPGGVGNEHDLVGRYFSDHLHLPLGILKPCDGATASEFYALRDLDGVAVRGGLSLTEGCRRRMRALGFAVTLHNADDPHDVFSLAQTRPTYRSLQTLVHAVRQGRRPPRALHHLRKVLVRLPEAGTLAYRRYVKQPARTFLIGCRAEQAPNPDSRVTLDERRDLFGIPKVRLDWRLSEQDLDNVRRAQSLLAASLRHDGVEMFPSRSGAGSRPGWENAISGGAHHMGTTRMHRDPRHGVVNEDCRVHGMTNLYVAGSSVFPTGGWAPPTLTIVALALRLADYLVTTVTPATHEHQ